MPSLTSVKYSNKKIMKIVKISVAALAAAALIGVGIYLLIHNGVFYKKVDTDKKTYAFSEQMRAVITESGIQQGYMFTRTSKLMMEDRLTDPWILSWYVIPGTTRSVPAMESAYVDTMDQVLLLRSYIKEGKRSKAEALIRAIDSTLTDGSGRLLQYKHVDDLGLPDRKVEERSDLYEDPAYLRMPDAPASMAATTEYLGALLDYYDKWGKADTLDKIRDLTAKVMEAGEGKSYRVADQLARPTPIPVTEKTLVTPDPSDYLGEDDVNTKPQEESGNGEKADLQLLSLTGMELSSMNLDALRRGVALVPKYQDRYDEIVSIVKGGKISETLPLYAWIYADGGYVYYVGSDANVDLVSSLYVMVHLAEIGQLDQDAYAWVAEQIYNVGFLYESYNIMSGLVGSDVECMEAYPLVLRLAQIQGDDGLFSATVDVMMRHYATLSTSPALYTFYRDVKDSRVAVYARENLLMELLLE